MFSPDDVIELFSRLKRANPEPKTELNYTNPYTLLVAVVLSAQATDKGVNLATAGLFAKVATPKQMLDLGEEGLTGFVKTIGLYRGKVKNVLALSKILVERHGGEVPRTREALEALPGVGRKTASVVLNVAFGERTIAVDTHVFRVANRTGLASGSDVRAVEDALMAVVPEQFLEHAHHWLILHGRYTCTARVPKCPECLLRDLCRFDGKTPAKGRP
jgi:endonuclease III